MFDVIAFDADDTLWENELLYQRTEGVLRDLLARYRERPLDPAELYATEQRNLAYFGYGVKGFALSLIETAIELTAGEVSARDIQILIDAAREMLARPVQLLDGVQEVVSSLAATHELMLVTKGDLMDQERKIASSGLAGYFKYVEIISEKDTGTYSRLFARHGLDPHRILMVGNSLRSDILPVVALGGHAVYIPYAATWLHETSAPAGASTGGYTQLSQIGLLPALVKEWEESGLPGR